MEQRPQTLSGGYKSRASLARTLASQPEVMLLDEPLVDLDAAIKETLLPDFKIALAARGVPIVYVTHDRLEAELLGDRFSVMIRGRLVPRPRIPAIRILHVTMRNCDFFILKIPDGILGRDTRAGGRGRRSVRGHTPGKQDRQRKGSAGGGRGRPFYCIDFH